MNEEIDEYDIYHQDFTTVSDWEVFIARIEEVLNDWHLTKSHVIRRSCSFTKKWISKSEEIKFLGHQFTISYHTLEVQEEDGTEQSKPKVDEKTLSDRILNGILSANKLFIDDCDGSPFPVSTWFGLNQYVMLTSQVPLLEEHHIRMVRSSINIAFANVDCGVPFFLKIREQWQQCFLGVFEDKELSTYFDTIHLKRIPNQCVHLNGLTSLFKGKIASPVPLAPVQISAKFCYELKDIDAFAWKGMFIYDDIFSEVNGKMCIELPFGADQNPLISAMLNITWPKFVENAVVDSSTYSDFDPIMAPQWSVNLKMRDDFACLLSDNLNRLLDLFDCEDLLMDTLGLSRSLGLVNPLHKITEAPITISKLVKAAIGSSTKETEFKGPISDDTLMPILYYIFPDAVEDDMYKYPENLEIEIKQGENTDPKLCSFIKSSPEGCLVWRLSIAALRLHDIGGLPYLAHLWYEFTQELQYRWERHILIPGIAEGNPNARTCLLHQKLQLLNCCIRRVLDTTGTNVGNSSEDEFFDASDGEGDPQTIEEPLGRLSLLEDAVMKNGQPLYIPRTQDPAPKTEDQLQEDAELMVRLGDDARASELRARMMSASLLSDMEAFKAANPGAELCDFVRWFSPRDWKPEDGGALGERMLLPDNPWVEAWSVARPLPIDKQRRLFDETREAEQVLHYLRSRSVSAVAELIFPALLRAGALKAVREGATTGGGSAGGCEQKRLFEIAVRHLFDAEKEASRMSLKKIILGDNANGSILDAAGRARILDVAGGTLPTVTRREFCLSSRDQHAPQMMRAALANDIFLIGAFTERTVLL